MSPKARCAPLAKISELIPSRRIGSGTSSFLPLTPITPAGVHRCAADGNTSLSTVRYLAGARYGPACFLPNLLPPMFNRKRKRREYRKRHLDHEFISVGSFECERNRVGGNAHDR